MAPIQLTTGGGKPSTRLSLDETTVQNFASSLRGKLIRPNDAEYDDARAVWNGMIDRRPALIARCTCVEDVVTAVRLAREQGLLVSVRGGGHPVAGHASPEANWLSAEDDVANLAWVRGFLAAIEEFSDGSRYLNFPGLQEEGDAMIRQVYGPNYDRLDTLKQKYDPNNSLPHQTLLPTLT